MSGNARPDHRRLAGGRVTPRRSELRDECTSGCRGPIVEAMIAHPKVRRVNFTGSTRVGKVIAASCAKYLKPAVLELGGKAPLLVLDDADLDAAVDAAVFGAFANSGQICMSTERIVVDRKVADAFVTRFAARAVKLPLGDPRNGPVVLGSVVDMSTVARCNALIDDALAKGATLACGGKADSTLMPAHVVGQRQRGHAYLPRRIVWTGQRNRARGRRRRGHCLRQRQRIWFVFSGVQPGHRARNECCQAH